MQKILFLVLVLFSPMAMAVNDPIGALSRLDHFLGNVPFAGAFRNGDSFDVLRVSCTGGHCDEMKARYDVALSSADGAQVSTTIAGRSQPHHLSKVSRKQWEEINGNRARDIIREVESYGVAVTIRSLQATTVSVVVNGATTTLPAMELSFVAQSQLGVGSEQTVVLTSGLRGPGQVVRRSIDEGAVGHTVIQISSCRLID